MAINDAIGSRMKEYYENIPKIRLMRKTPVAIRIDGKAFHTFTKGFHKPFDPTFANAMMRTMQQLCMNIQGCVFGYTQSDEITLILIDYQTFDTDAWFGYQVEKMCSVAASMATLYFYQNFNQLVKELGSDMAHEFYTEGRTPWLNEVEPLYDVYRKALENGAMFDARVFNIPKEEVANLLYWRQLDATRNSIQSVGQANFSQSELQNKTNNQIQDMLLTQRDINWNDFPTMYKRGSCCYKNEGGWVVDTEMPILKGEGRSIIENRIYI